MVNTSSEYNKISKINSSFKDYIIQECSNWCCLIRFFFINQFQFKIIENSFNDSFIFINLYKYLYLSIYIYTPPLHLCLLILFNCLFICMGFSSLFSFFGVFFSYCDIISLEYLRTHPHIYIYILLFYFFLFFNILTILSPHSCAFFFFVPIYSVVTVWLNTTNTTTVVWVTYIHMSNI